MSSIPRFDKQEKEVPITAFRRRPRLVYNFIDIPGHVGIVTKRSKRMGVIMSIETYAFLTGRYEETMAEIETLCKEYRENGKLREKTKES